MTRTVFVALVFLVLPPIAHAETTTFVCDYATWSDQDGNHPVKTEFVLTFLVDGDTGKAYMIGNAGSEEVKIFSGDDYVSFIEITATGNIMTTAIASDGTSVHSRNSILFGEIIPSQYYGTCVSR